MAIDYQETDGDGGAPSGSAYCAGVAAAWTTSHDRAAVVGGSAGSVAVGHQNVNSGLSAVVHPRIIAPASGVTWEAGTWTINHNVTTANANLTITGCYICRLNSSFASQATIGSRTDLSISLGTTGVKQFTVTGASQSPSEGDLVAVLIQVSSAAMNSSHSYTPNQIISSPFTETLADNRGVISFSEMETPLPPRKLLVSWSEAEFPLVSRRGFMSWAELEAPLAPRNPLVTFAEFELPLAPRQEIIAWAELEVPSLSADRQALVTFGEFELPLGARSAIVAWVEAEAPLAPRYALVSWTEIETPLGARKVLTSWTELEVPIVERNQLVAWAELQVPDVGAPPASPYRVIPPYRHLRVFRNHHLLHPGS